MALTGIQIYKLLPQTNCKECGYPTCLAFAMKLAAKQAELSACPYVSDESKAQLAESSAPPIRLITLRSNGHEVKAGNEVVMYRHEKTFYNKPGLFIKITDSMPLDQINPIVSAAEQYSVNYVGINLSIDGFAIESESGQPGQFSTVVEAVREISKRPIILISQDVNAIKSALQKLPDEQPMVCGVNEENWQEMAVLAKAHGASVAVMGDNLEFLADFTEKITSTGLEDIVLYPTGSGLSTLLALNTQIRRLALKKNFRALGYPVISFANNPEQAVQAITKYSNFIVLNDFSIEAIYPLLVLRQNIYTDPQKPIQVQPGLYEINNPQPESPVLVTTNFSITYFSVANEVEGSGLPAWLLVSDSEGMSVLTAWAAGKFDSERIAKSVKEYKVEDKVSQKRIVIPGAVAVLSGELEEELPGWEIRVGPREAVDIPKFMKLAL